MGRDALGLCWWRFEGKGTASLIWWYCLIGRSGSAPVAEFLSPRLHCASASSAPSCTPRSLLPPCPREASSDNPPTKDHPYVRSPHKTPNIMADTDAKAKAWPRADPALNNDVRFSRLHPDCSRANLRIIRFSTSSSVPRNSSS